MGIYKVIKSFAKSPYFPLRFEGTAMRPNILLMCKLMFALLLAHGFYNYIQDPFIPFFSFFEEFRSSNHIFKIVLRALFFVSGFFLIFNYKVKNMSIILGLVVIITLLASKPIFANHKFICGCVLLLAGLTNKERDPWLIYIQFSLVYFGAAINKVIQIDWWNGAFMHNWMVNAQENEAFITIAKMLPDLLLAKVLSLSSIFIEFLIATLILFRKKHNLVVFMIIIFHTSLYTVTTLRFGHFYEDILILLLVFLNWPKEDVIIYYNQNNLKWINSAFLFLGHAKHFSFFPKRFENNIWLEIKFENHITQNLKALPVLLLYSPIFYLSLFAVDIGVFLIFNGFLRHFTHLTLIWICIIFFLTISLSKVKKFGYPI